MLITVVHDIDPEGTRVAFGGLVQRLADILKLENFITVVTVIPHVNYIGKCLTEINYAL
jgi:hypothetical protein